MSWRRLPACLPNLPLRLVPLSDAQQKAYEATGFVKQLVFKTVPSVGKVCVCVVFCVRGAIAPTSPPLLTPASLPPHHTQQLEIREYLRAVYGLDIASVRTLIAAGKKKRGKHGYYARPDVKKAFVTLKGKGPASPPPPQA